MQGIVITKPDPPFGLPLSPDQWLYLFSLGVAAVAVRDRRRTWCAGGSGGRWSRSATTPLAAEAMGIDLALLKTRSFAVSALFTGIAGSLGAIAVQFVAPDSFTVLAVDHLVRRHGGRRRRLDLRARCSARCSSSSCPNLAEQVSKAAPGAIYGVILIACLYLMPSGVAGAGTRPGGTAASAARAAAGAAAAA